MHPHLELVLAMSGFVGSHFLLSWPPLRRWLVGRLDAGAFTAVYALIASITLVWAVRAYAAAPYEELWQLGELGRWVTHAIMPLACVLVQCLANDSS